MVCLPCTSSSLTECFIEGLKLSRFSCGRLVRKILAIVVQENVDCAAFLHEVRKVSLTSFTRFNALIRNLPHGQANMRTWR